MSRISIVPSASNIAQLASQVRTTNRGWRLSLRILLCLLQGLALLMLLALQMFSIGLRSSTRDSANIAIMHLLYFILALRLLALLERISFFLPCRWLLLIRVNGFAVLLGHVNSSCRIQSVVVARISSRSIGGRLFIRWSSRRRIGVSCCVLCHFLLNRSSSWRLSVSCLGSIRINITRSCYITGARLLIISFRRIICLSWPSISVVVRWLWRS